MEIPSNTENKNFMSNSILLPYPKGCVQGHFLRRVKRFSVEMELPPNEDTASHSETIWTHSNNSGSMTGLLRYGASMVASPAANPARKLHWTQELMQVRGTTWVGVNTQVPNKLLEAAFYAGALPWAAGYTHFQREVVRGESRLDACLTGENLPKLWVECKSVTMVEDGVAAFPDAVSERGQKHLRALTDIVQNGERGAMFYCIQRNDGHCFAPAVYIDPVYAALYEKARQVGVEIYPHLATIHLPHSDSDALDTFGSTASSGSTGGIGIGGLLPLAPVSYYE